MTGRLVQNLNLVGQQKHEQFLKKIKQLLYCGAHLFLHLNLSLLDRFHFCALRAQLSYTWSALVIFSTFNSKNED